MNKIYLHKLGNTAQSHYREHLPAKHCSTSQLEIICNKELRSLDYDAFLFPRLLNPNFMNVLKQIRGSGKKIIWSTDDDLWNIPFHNPAHRMFNKEAIDIIKQTVDLSHHIVVSTDDLKQVVKDKTGRDAVVLPNLIDLDDWPGLPSRQDDSPLKIIWAGSHHHNYDLMEITEALEMIMNEYGHDVQVLFMGDWPQSMSEWCPIQYTHLARQVPHPRYKQVLGFVDSVPLNEFPTVLASLRPDIGLCPLTSETFNNSKSNLKWMEYSMVGAASITSRMPPYDNTTSFKATPGDVNSWIKPLKRLIEDEECRRTLASDATDDVINNYSWQNSSYKKDWVKFFEEVVNA